MDLAVGCLLGVTAVQWTFPLLVLAGDQRNAEIAALGAVVFVTLVAGAVACRAARWKSHGGRGGGFVSAVGLGVVTGGCALAIALVQHFREQWAERLVSARCAAAAGSDGVTEAAWLFAVFVAWLFQTFVLAGIFAGGGGAVRSVGRAGRAVPESGDPTAGVGAAGPPWAVRPSVLFAMGGLAAIALLPVALLPDVRPRAVDGGLSVFWVLAAVAAAVDSFQRSLRRRRSRSTSSGGLAAIAVCGEAAGGRQSNAAAGAAATAHLAGPAFVTAFVLAVVQATAAGAALMAFGRLAAQWALSGPWTVYAPAAGAVGGMVGVLRSGWCSVNGAAASDGFDPTVRETPFAGWRSAVVFAWPSLMIAGSAAIVRALFAARVSLTDARSHQTILTVLLACGALPLGALAADAGTCLAALLRSRDGGRNSARSRASAIAWAAAWTGGAVGGLMLLPATGPMGLLGGCGLLAAASYLGWTWVCRAAARSRSSAGGEYRRWGPSAAVSLAAAFAAVVASDESIDHATGLLFRAESVAAARSGIPWEWAEAVVDGRCSRVVHGTCGSYTVWRQRGWQVHLRRNGVPLGSLSLAPRVCPQSAADVLLAALPLTLRPRAESVGIIGAGGLGTLATALAFPLVDVTVFEPDSALVAYLRAWRESRDGGARLSPAVLLADSRLRVSPGGLWAAAAVPERFDALLCCIDGTTDWSGTGVLCREFYRRAAAALKPGGIYCGRLSYVDWDAAALADFVDAVRAGFREVCLVEPAAGVFLVVATNAPGGISTDAWLSWLQTPHVRSVLADAGWDWANVTQLPMLDSKDVLEAIGRRDHGSGDVLGASLAGRLPRLVLQWGGKMESIVGKLAVHATTTARWLGERESDPQLQRRLRELRRRRELVEEAEDRYWVYRKDLKRLLLEEPRSVIRTVSGTVSRDMHPDDRRRVQYLAALGAAARSARPSGEQIARVLEFSRPFDPLVSLFAEAEAAMLWKRSDDADPRAELACWLHVAFFTSPRDVSVRPITESLRLLSEHSDLVADESTLANAIDGLLQMLHRRWLLRDRRPSRGAEIALSDATESLMRAEQAMSVVGELCKNDPRLTGWWSRRRPVLESTLIRDLRRRRRELLRKLRTRDRSATGGTTPATTDGQPAARGQPR